MCAKQQVPYAAARPLPACEQATSGLRSLPALAYMCRNTCTRNPTTAAPPHTGEMGVSRSQLKAAVYCCRPSTGMYQHTTQLPSAIHQRRSTLCPGRAVLPKMMSSRSGTGFRGLPRSSGFCARVCCTLCSRRCCGAAGLPVRLPVPCQPVCSTGVAYAACWLLPTCAATSTSLQE